MTVSSPQSSLLQVLELTQSERLALRGLESEICSSPYGDFEGFYREVVAARGSVPERVRAELLGYRRRPRSGCMLIRNVPLDDNLPPTPGVPFAQGTLQHLRTEPYLVLLASIVGEPFSFEQWDAGHLVQNKYPIASHRDVQFGSNAVEFLTHTETPFRQFSPDYLALLCLRGDPGREAKTRLCDIGRIIDDLPEPEKEVLRGPYFAFATDNPVVVIEGQRLTQPLPIVISRDGREVVEFVQDLVAITDEAKRVLDALKATVKASTEEIVLEKGDLLIMDNSHIAHGLSSYEPSYDGRDRWLQRLLLTTRLFREGERPETRLVPDRRLQNYPTEYQNVLRGLVPNA